MEKFEHLDNEKEKPTVIGQEVVGGAEKIKESSAEKQESGKEAKESSKSPESLGFSKKMRQVAAMAVLPFFLMGKEPVFASEKAESKESLDTKKEFVLSEKAKTLSEKFSLIGFPEKEREAQREKIGFELDVLSSIGDDIKKQVEQSGQKLPGVNFEDRAVEKILEMEDFQSMLPSFLNPKKEIEKFNEKRFGEATLNLGNFKDAMGLYGAGQFVSLFAAATHELGHAKAMEKEGMSGRVNIKPLIIGTSGHVDYVDGTWERRSDEIAREVVSEKEEQEIWLGIKSNISKGGVAATGKMSKGVIDFLKSEQDFSLNNKMSPFLRQMLAIFALETRADSFLYASITMLSKDDREIANELASARQENDDKKETQLYSSLSPNDIIRYSVATNTPVEEVCMGLLADFIFDPDVWKTMRIAFGEEGVKFSDTTLKFVCDLGESGLSTGLEFNTKF